MIEFTVLGCPVPQGSMKGFVIRGRARLTSDNPALKDWRLQVAGAAMMACTNRELLLQDQSPREIRLKFFFRKPLSAPKYRTAPTVRPDLDKLTRAILDSLTGILYSDDALVTRFGHIEKYYGTPERVEISLMRAI